MIEYEKPVLLTALVVAMTAGALAAPAVTTADRDGTVPPGTSQEYATFTVWNDATPTTLESISITGLPFTFNTTATPVSIAANGTRNVTVDVSVEDGFSPGLYTGTASFAFNDSAAVEKKVDITVPTVENVTVDDTSFRSSLSVGSTSSLGNITLSNTGNVKKTLETRVTGNISQYLSVQPSFTVYPGPEKRVVVETSVPRTTRFGRYGGHIHLEAVTGDWNRTIPVNASFLDEIPPVVDSTDFPNFMATQPENFTVHVQDNVGVGKVSAEVVYTEEVVKTYTVEEGDETVEKENRSLVNRTHTTLDFVSVSDSPGRWTVQPPGDRIGEYFVRGTVTDEAGNTVNFTEQYEVEGLHAVSVSRNTTLPKMRKGEEVNRPIVDLFRETTLTVQLRDFDKPMHSQNETWKIGIVEPDGTRRIFDNEGDEFTVTGEGEIQLFLYGSEPDFYVATFALKPVEQHVDLPGGSDSGEGIIQVSGQLVNWTVPEDQNMTVADLMHDCSAVRGDTQEESGWDCSYFVSASKVDPGKSLAESLQTVVPQQYKEAQVENFQNTIDRWKRDARSNAFWMWVFGIAAAGLGGGFVFYWRRGEKIMVMPHDMQVLVRAKTMRERGELGGGDY